MIIFKPRALCPAGYTSNPERASFTESLLYLGKDKTTSDGLCVIAAKHIQAILFDSCFFVNITIVELSKQLLFSCNIHLCGLFAFFFLEREWKRSSFAEQMFSQLRFIKHYFTFPFVFMGVYTSKTLPSHRLFSVQ